MARAHAVPRTWQRRGIPDIWGLVSHSYARIERAIAPYGAADWDTVYGCGMMGCVLPIIDGGGRPTRYVAKITADEVEGAVIAAILQTGLDKVLDGLVRFERVWKLTPPPQKPIRVAKGQPAVECGYLIVREDVRPWTEGDRRAYYAALHKQRAISAPNAWDVPWISALDDYAEAIDHVPLLDEAGVTEEDVDAGALAALATLQPLQDYAETQALHAAITTLWDDAGILLMDQHLDQFGVRTHTWPSGQGPDIVRWWDDVDRPALLTFDVGLSVVDGVQPTCPTRIPPPRTVPDLPA